MRIFSSCLLAAVCAVFSAVAHADTVSFASSPTTTTYTSGNTTGAAAAYTNPAYGAPLAGSSFVSTSSTGGNGSLGVNNFTNTFTLLANETYSGSVSFLADDFASIFVNGLNIFNQAYSPTGSTYTMPTTVSLLPSYFRAGSNNITFALNNIGGVTAIDFAGSVTGVTPEPSSLMLLGTGMLGLAGAVRRRLAA